MDAGIPWNFLINEKSALQITWRQSFLHNPTYLPTANDGVWCLVGENLNG
jgi:hypothetical protein